jgi:alkylation response protein AidB-like acyl-CoA dehydrogenase
MQFAFTEEQQQLRRGARRLLGECASPAQLRAVMASDGGYDPVLWRRAGELGWTALTIPEALGGLGLGPVELVALMEETGRVLWCAPYFSTVCLATNALLLAGTDHLQRQWLPVIADGRCLATVAWGAVASAWGVRGSAVTARRDRGDFILSGVDRQVIDGHIADLLIVVAQLDDAGGLAWFAVPAAAPGVDAQRVPTIDLTRTRAKLALRDVRVPAHAQLIGADRPDAGMGDVLDLARIALAAEQVGGAQACLDMAVGYAKVRRQFGRAIGSFQAIKHRCADLLVRVESARSAAYGAACAAVDRIELTAMAALASAYCSEAFYRCAADNLQIHGGIGFTWEHDAHLYFKRARASRALLGDPSWQRDRIAREMGL